jgi:hypothetical protein
MDAPTNEQIVRLLRELQAELAGIKRDLARLLEAR